VWHWTAPHGRSAGILLGVNLDVLDVGSIEASISPFGNSFLTYSWSCS
jgi:hypothetical protein